MSCIGYIQIYVDILCTAIDIYEIDHVHFNNQGVNLYDMEDMHTSTNITLFLGRMAGFGGIIHHTVHSNIK